LSDTFSRSEDPITVEDDIVTDIARGREVQYRNTGEASMSWQFGAEDIATLGYRNRLLNSDSDQTEDSRANEGFLNLDTWFVPQFGIGLTSSFARWNFQQPNNFTGVPTEDFRQYQAGLTVNYRRRPSQLIYGRYNVTYQDFGGNTEGADDDDYVVHEPTVGVGLNFSPYTELTAEAGYFYQDRENANDEEGFVLNASFSTRGERTSFGIQTNSGYNLDYGTSDNEGFSKYSDNSASVDYQLVENLNIFASARYRWEDYTETNRTDHTYGGRAGLRYTFRRWLSGSLEGGHLRRDSNEDNREFTDNRVTLRVIASYPLPLYGE